MVVPLVRDRVAPLFGADTTGYCVLSAGIVLAVMIVPVLVHITLEVLRAVPNDLRNAALSLGATRWQMARGVLLRRCRAGIFSAVGIAVSRALGETMAVLMVAGNVWEVPRSAFDPCYPLPALIANNYGEILSIPRYEAAIMLAALVLFGVVVLFNAVSKAILMRIEEGVA
jgi:phosphate transport system permease protein